MTENEARAILGDMVHENGSITGLDPFTSWSPILDGRENLASMDGDYTADQLEAIAVLMRSTPRQEKPGPVELRRDSVTCHGCGLPITRRVEHRCPELGFAIVLVD